MKILSLHDNVLGNLSQTLPVSITPLADRTGSMSLMSPVSSSARAHSGMTTRAFMAKDTRVALLKSNRCDEMVWMFSRTCRRFTTRRHSVTGMLYSQAVAGRQGPAASSPAAAIRTRPGTASLSVSESAGAHTKPAQDTVLPKHKPKDAHRPRTSEEEEHVYVLTLNTTPSLHKPVTALREKHFPAHLNRTPAHLTMFHALPGSHMPSIVAAIEKECQDLAPFRLTTGSLFRMRRGVGINTGQGAQPARLLHQGLQKRWVDVLSEQDRQAWRPHWTIQNKVNDAAVVEETMREVEQDFQGAEGVAEGCVLWRYERGGAWRFERMFEFGGAK